MDPLLDEDQQSYQQSLRRFFESRWTDDEVRASLEGPHDAESGVWSQLADQLGVAGLIVPEEYGGSGWAPAEALLVAEEMGRALYGGPYLGTVVLATNALLLSDDAELAGAVLPSLVSGERTATLAVATRGRDRAATDVPRARTGPEGWLINGSATRVIDGGSADLVIVEADSSGGRSLFLLESGSGLVSTAEVPLDPTRRMATLEFRDVPARLIGREGAAAEVIEKLSPRVALFLAAEAVGGASRCIGETVAYAKVREQFGRPIGSFQAVKHRCAEMQVRLEGAVAGVRHAGRIWVKDDEALDLLASVLKVYATESYFRTAADMVQLHGGIGFTWEHSAHLHFKRAKSLELMWGSPQDHREAIADVVLPAPR